jgi:Fur family ferric uptake transcriptional regulator
MDLLAGDATLDRATVYRNLADLARVDLLRRYDLGDHVWRYEVAEGAEHDASGHAHFVCVTCGDVTCIDDVELRIPPAHQLPRAVKAASLEIQLKGVCDDCA